MAGRFIIQKVVYNHDTDSPMGIVPDLVACSTV